MATDEEITPTAEQVALLLRTRTTSADETDTGMTDTGAFTAATRPSLVDVEKVIVTARDEVKSRLYPAGPIPESQIESTRHAVALYTAVLIEVSFFREQAGDQAVTALRELFDQTMGMIYRAIVNTAGGTPLFGSIPVGTTRERYRSRSPVDHVEGL